MINFSPIAVGLSLYDPNEPIILMYYLLKFYIIRVSIFKNI